MRLVEIAKQDNGAHRNITIFFGLIDKIPEGWALIPDYIETENFPFGDLTAIELEVEDPSKEKNDDAESVKVMTVIEWIPGIKPEPGEGEAI